MPHPRVNYRLSMTGADPLDLHLAHIRHLSCPASLAGLLSERFNRTKKQAKADAAEISPFLDQGIGFLNAAKQSDPAVAPVLLYYAYLNLAVAVVRAYRPTNWEQYKSHGAIDRTKALTRISLSSKLAKVQQGAIPLFHSVYSKAPLIQRDYSLRELVCSIPDLTAELGDVYSIKNQFLFVRGRIAPLEEEGVKLLRSEITFEFLNQRVQRFPTQRLHKAIPFLKTDYYVHSKRSRMRVYRSDQSWTPGNRERAQRRFDADVFLASNYGSRDFFNNEVDHRWVVPPSEPLLPTLTGSMLLLFSLSSLSRYRANVLRRVESSKLNLLMEVFRAEVDAIMLPALRNLLYCESVMIERSGKQ